MSTELLDTLESSLADRYDVSRELGRGGMSIVYEATDRRHNRTVAIKVLRPEFAGAVVADRFLREIQIEASLQHPHILPLLDSGKAGELPFCVLPFVAGQTLRSRLRAEGQLPIADALRITAEIASALGYAHKSGIVHRDVKPENILLSEGHALLADFGIARAISTAAPDRLTSEGIAVGTPAYMSPEQAGGSEHLDGRSDLYSLGVVLFEMLAGQPPFTGRSVDAIIAQHRLEPPPSLRTLRATVPEGLEHAVLQVLAKSPADRYADAEQFLAALHAPAPRAKSSTRVRVATAAVSILAAAIITWFTWLRPAPLDDNAVAVFPVRDLSAGSGAALLADDIAYAIELALDHARPLKWIHGWDWLDEDVRRDPTRLDARLQGRAAKRHNARYFIDGVVQRNGTETSVVLRLYDALADTAVAIESAKAAGGTDLATLGLEATQKLLLRWLAPGRARDLEPLRSVRPAALALQLQGEREYRSARFSRALALYERAYAEDSTFAYAAVKAAQSASWLNLLARAESLARKAATQQALLPAQYRPFVLGLEAYLGGRADSAVNRFRAALEIAPDWDEAHMALGEVYHHLIPSGSALDSLAEAEFRAAAARDSAFTPPLAHLGEFAGRRGSVRDLQEIIERFQRVGADESWIRELGVMRDCLRDGATTRWTAVAREDVSAALAATMAFSGGGLAQPQCAESGARALLALQGEEGSRWGALLVRHGSLVARGLASDALRMLDSARAAGTSAVLFLYVMDAVAGAPFAERADSVLAFAQRVYGADYERAQLGTPDTRGALALWVVAVWHRVRGESDRVQQIADRLTTAARAAPDNRRLTLLAGAVAGHAALARADTAESIRLLGALVSTARRDSLLHDHVEALAVERFVLASLLLKRREFATALEVASAFDHTGPVSFLPFLPASLRLRAEAADSLGDSRLASRYRERLSLLDRASGPGPRR